MVLQQAIWMTAAVVQTLLSFGFGFVFLFMFYKVGFPLFHACWLPAVYITTLSCHLWILFGFCSICKYVGIPSTYEDISQAICQKLVSPAEFFIAEIQCVHMLIQVAARVTADDAENHEWIVVKVTRYDRDTNKLVSFFHFWGPSCGEGC